MGAGFTRPLKEFRQRTHRRLLLLGLDGAGKTSIATLARASSKRPRGESSSDGGSSSSSASQSASAGGGGPGASPAGASVADGGFAVETFRRGALTFHLWDVGGGEQLRPYWRHYYTGTQGVLFVVDASDRARVALAAAELRGAAADEQLSDAAVAIVATHAGAPGALTLAELAAELQPESALAGHAWTLLAVDAVAGGGGAGLDAVWAFFADKTRRL